MAEQVNPNALGAPAEGFGQTVSFAFDPRGELPQMQPVASQSRGGGFSNVSQPRASNPQVAYNPLPKQDATSALLLKVGDEMLSKQIEQERTAKFVEGMQQAMNGEAMKDIVESVPWYAKLFGDTPAIEGARAYTAASKVSETVAKQTANMHQLQTMDGAAAAKHFSGIINSNLTGDAGTDTVIMKGMTEQLPTLMKAQAKAFYGYNQKQAMGALSKNMSSSASTLQSYGELFADGKLTEDDMRNQSKAFVASAMPPAGVDEDNYTKTLVGNMLSMAQQGQFHALEALKASGVLGALSPEQGTRIDAAIVAQATKARDNYAFTFAREIAEIKSDASMPQDGTTPRSISDRIDAMSEKYRRLTGSPVGLFSSDQKADMLNGTFNAIKAAQVRAAAHAETIASKGATANAKELAAAQLEGEVRTLISNGDFPALGVMAGVSSDMVHRNVLAMIKENPQAGGDLLANAWMKGKYVNPVIQSQLQYPLSRSEGSALPTDEWFEAVTLFDKMKAGPGALLYAQAYFGDYAVKLQRASSMFDGNILNHPQSARIFQATMGGTQAQPKQPLSAKEKEKFLGNITNLNSSALVRQFTGDTKLRPDTLALVADVGTEATENWRGADLPDSEAVAMGLASAITSGKLEIIGGFAIKNMDGKKDGKAPASLKELASTRENQIPSDKADEYFEGFMQDFKKIPTDGTIQLLRMGESGGNHKFRVSSMKDGVMQGVWEFNSTEWQTYAAGRTKTDTVRAANGPWAFGPALTYVKPSTPDTISIYATAAERAQKQAEIAKRHQLKP